MNLYFLAVLNGILEANTRHGQNTVIFPVTDWQQNEPKLLDFCDGRGDGVICIGPKFSPAFAEALQQHTPFITLHSNELLPNTHNLDVDNEAGAFAVTQYLISQGHRRLLHFPGMLSLTGAQCRLNGYKRPLTSAGIPFTDSLVVPGHHSASSGRERMTLVLDAGQSALRPTALFCASDAIAYGCMEVLAERGLHVPQDLSIAGFDDSLTARMTVPPLTTVRQPLREMGRVVPTADNLVTFTAHGVAQVVGVGNGDPSSHEPDRASQRHAFNGLCLAVVQAGETPGAAHFTATSDGLASASLDLKAAK